MDSFKEAHEKAAKEVFARPVKRDGRPRKMMFVDYLLAMEAQGWKMVGPEATENEIRDATFAGDLAYSRAERICGSVTPIRAFAIACREATLAAAPSIDERLKD